MYINNSMIVAEVTIYYYIRFQAPTEKTTATLNQSTEETGVGWGECKSF